MTFSLSPEPAPEAEQTWPVVLPNGETAYCPVDHNGRIDPRGAYRPWLDASPSSPPPAPRRPLPPPRSNR